MTSVRGVLLPSSRRSIFAEGNHCAWQAAQSPKTTAHANGMSNLFRACVLIIGLPEAKLAKSRLGALSENPWVPHGTYFAAPNFSKPNLIGVNAGALAVSHRISTGLSTEMGDIVHARLTVMPTIGQHGELCTSVPG